MAISTVLVAFLAADPDPATSTSMLAASEFGRAGVRAFEASLLAAEPRAAWSPFAADSDAAKSLLSYTYAELGVSRTDVDLIDEDADAAYLKGSFSLLKFFNIIGGIERAEADFGNNDITVDSYFLGAGAHIPVPIFPTVHAVGEALWLYDDVDFDNAGSDSDSGYSLYLGGRWLVLPFASGGVEIAGGYRYTNIEGLASEEITNTWELGARVHFLKFLSVGATYALIDDDRRATVNVRFSF